MTLYSGVWSPSIFLLMALSLPAFGEIPGPGKQVEQTFEMEGEAQPISYLIYLPPAYLQDSSRKWPLLLFLHGRGESNGPLNLVTKWGPPRLIAEGQHFPYIVVSPQCPRTDSWDSDVQQNKLCKLLDFLESKYPLDAERLYLTGLSMGGFGSWRLAADFPERFAAMVPICGGGRVQDAKHLAKLPIWVWHGDQDKSVGVERSLEMVTAIRAVAGTRIKLTILEEIGHNSWSAAYATPDLYRWLDQQRRLPPPN